MTVHFPFPFFSLQAAFFVLALNFKRDKVGADDGTQRFIAAVIFVKMNIL